MKIVLVQNLVHLPSYGGASKSNRLMLERLAARGHECHVVAPALGSALPWSVDDLLHYLVAAGARIESSDRDALDFRQAGVHVHAVLRASRFPRAVARAVDALAPDRVLVPGDDPGFITLAAAHGRRPGRVVYLLHTIQHLPFGPGSFHPSEEATRLVRASAGIVTVSKAAADYLERWGGLKATVIRPDVYGEPAAAVRSDPGGPVVMVNPCDYKGIDVFLALAAHRPRTAFRAVLSWGATEDDVRALRAAPNVETHPPVDDLEEVLDGAAAVVMPSLWDETFGYTCVEAMLRGVPVLAADVGGLPEAKLGVPFLLPVRPITGYRYVPGRARPVPTVPDQPWDAWTEALDRLLDDRALHAQVSARSLAAAGTFTAGLDEDALERFLLELPPPAGGERVPAGTEVSR